MKLSSAFALALLGAAVAFVSAVMPPDPSPFYVTLPNGEEAGPFITNGSPGAVWVEDEQGHTVILNDGMYYYAQQAPDGDIEASPIPWSKGGMRSLSSGDDFPTHIRPSEAIQMQRCGEFCADEASQHEHINRVATTGTLKNLVVLVQFKDHADENRGKPSEADIDILMNHPGDGTSGNPFHGKAPSGSVRNHYLKSSYDTLIIDSTVAAWVTVNGTQEECSGNNFGFTQDFHDCLKDALDQVDDLVDFADFDTDSDGYIDAITFLQSGYGAEFGGTVVTRIWSHKWQFNWGVWTSTTGVKVYRYHVSPAVWGTSGSAIGRIGVVTHETGHYLGLPDLYDSDNNGSGIGSWGLMANSWGFDSTQYYPPQMSAWSKIQLGWANVEVIEPREESYTLEKQCDSNTLYKITRKYPSNEYLLIENRDNSCHYDSQSPVSGLAIYHIDDSAGYNTQGHPDQAGWPENGNHYRVALLQADGDYGLEKKWNRGDQGDLYKDGDELGKHTSPNTNTYQNGIISTTNNCIDQITTSGTNRTFRFDVCEQAPSLNPSQTPSNAPTSSERPSNAPTGLICDEPEVIFGLEVQFDQYASEFSWYLYDGNGNEVDGRPFSHYPSSTYSYATVTEALCVDPEECYTLHVQDSWGDGICCYYSNGYYKATLDGVLVATGGDYGQGESTTFGECSDDSTNAPSYSTKAPSYSTKAPSYSPTKSPTDSPSASPTDSPSASPTDSPSASPTDSPTASLTDSPTFSPTECQDQEGKVKIGKNNKKYKCEDYPDKSFLCKKTKFEKHCPVTCGICTGPPTDSPTSSPTKNGCQDEEGKVEIGSNQYECDEYPDKSNLCKKEKFKKHCPISCDYCGVEIKDKYRTCDEVFEGTKYKYCKKDKFENVCRHECNGFVKKGKWKLCSSVYDKPDRCDKKKYKRKCKPECEKMGY